MVRQSLGRLCFAFCTGLCSVACNDSPPVTLAAPPYQVMLTTADFMDWVLDPAANVILGSAGTITTLDGEADFAPTTEAEWDAVRNTAALIAESGNLLMLPGRAVDDGDWMELSRGLITVGERAIAAAEARDDEQLFDVGGQIYNVCLACHQRYIREDGDADAA